MARRNDRFCWHNQILPRLGISILGFVLLGGLLSLRNDLWPISLAGETQQMEVTTSSWADLLATLPKYRGKVVVIDLWSTSCDPCLKEYPGILALQKKYPQEVVCISMNCDYIGVRTKPVEYYKPRVLEFLQSQNSKITHAICNEPADELFEKLKLDSIPAVYVFDQQGKQIQRFDGQYVRPAGLPAAKPAEDDEEESKFSYEQDVSPFVERLLKK